MRKLENKGNKIRWSDTKDTEVVKILNIHVDSKVPKILCRSKWKTLQGRKPGISQIETVGDCMVVDMAEKLK